MVEFIDNLTQLLVVLTGCILSGLFYLQSRRQPYFLLCCFYGCFGFSILYWLLYTILITDASPMFYVADIGWISCYLFFASTAIQPFGQRGTHASKPPAVACTCNYNTAHRVLYQHRQSDL